MSGVRNRPATGRECDRSSCARPASALLPSHSPAKSRSRYTAAKLKTSLHLPRRLARRKRFLLAALKYAYKEALLVLGAVVWVFALIGIFSVVQAMDPPATWVPSFLDTHSRLEKAVIPDLPEYPGATRSEYRAEVFGDERVTEIEYIVDSSVPEVRDHYRDAFARGDWTVTDTTWLRGEWVYTVNRGDRRGVVEIENRDGVIEVEVEMAEPAGTRRESLHPVR